MTEKTLSGLKFSDFQGIIDGKEVKLIVLKSENSSELVITNYGLTYLSYLVPNKNNSFSNILLTLPTLADCQKNTMCMGTSIGRYSNRIGNAKFKIGDQEYQLPVNNPPNNLHSGPVGMQNKVWDIIKVSETDAHFRIIVEDGFGGFPGTLTTNTFVSIDNSGVSIKTEATTTKPTVCNLTSHGYFNLGDHSKDILRTRLRIDSEKFVPNTDQMIPTGELRPVKNTPFDFREFHEIGERIGEDYEQLHLGEGYDHSFLLKPGFSRAARAESNDTGIALEIWTSHPGVHFYTGNHLGGFDGIDGEIKYRFGFCLETGYLPDSPNQPNFPSCLLNPGETFSHTVSWRPSLI